MWMLWTLLLVIAHDLLEYLDTWVTSEETCFFFVVLFNIARGFENVYEIILD